MYEEKESRRAVIFTKNPRTVTVRGFSCLSYTENEGLSERPSKKMKDKEYFMATFTNQATLTYNGQTTTSNVTVGELTETLTAAKYWPFPTYGDLLFGVR